MPERTEPIEVRGQRLADMTTDALRALHDQIDSEMSADWDSPAERTKLNELYAVEDELELRDRA